VLPAHPNTVSRRAFVAGACGACVAALSACATYGSGSAPAPASGAPAAPQGQSAPTKGGGAAPANALARTSEIPVGGGTIFADHDVVVTQPVAGQFHAFGATCTHQGCPVTEVTGGTINCNCHGSKFAVADGSVVDGPAKKPLPKKNISVDGQEIQLA
jgi:Rieske Fe-S protein